MLIVLWFCYFFFFFNHTRFFFGQSHLLIFIFSVSGFWIKIRKVFPTPKFMGEITHSLPAIPLFPSLFTFYFTFKVQMYLMFILMYSMKDGSIFLIWLSSCLIIKSFFLILTWDTIFVICYISIGIWTYLGRFHYVPLVSSYTRSILF